MTNTVKLMINPSKSAFSRNREGQLIPKFEGTKEVFVPRIDLRTGLLKTGLTKEDETYFENELSLPTGTLKSSSAYWDSFFINIPDKGLILNLNEPIHELYFKVLSNDPYVAKSPEQSLSMARCHYVLYDEETKAKEINVKRKEKTKAYSLFSKLSSVEIVNILYLYGLEASSSSPEFNESKLWDLMENNHASFISFLEDKDLELKVFITKAVSAGIITKSGSSASMEVPLFYRENALGIGLKETVIFLKDKANQNIYLAIKKQYNDYRKDS